MKYKMTVISAVVAGSLLGLVASSEAQFSYSAGDLFVGFRQAGSPDLIVDIGQASLYQAYQPNMPFTVSGGVSSALSATYGSNLNNLYWSVFSYQSSDNTLFTTSARSDITMQTDPTASAGSSSQGIVRAYMHSILNGATSPSATSLTTTAATIPSSLNQSGELSYTVGVQVPSSTTEPGNFRGSWSPVENFTGASFTGSSVSDLYQNAPGNPLTTVGSYLGNFSLDNTGDLVFNPVPEPGIWAVFGVGIITLFAVRRIGRKNLA
jgi:hypothetical protein